MESLGEFLKTERESRNISLEEISKKTRVSINILNAIESDDKERLPGDIFVKGFLKAYAKCLDLDESEVLSLYEGSKDNSETEEDEEFHREFIDDFFEKKSPKPAIYAAVIIIAAIILLYYFYDSSGVTIQTEPKVTKKSEDIQTEKLAEDVFVFEDESTPKKITLAEKEPAPVTEKPPLRTPTPAAKSKKPEKAPDVSARKKTVPVKKSPVIKEGEGHKLTFRSDGIVWMQIQIDENEPYEVTLHEDETYSIKAAEKFTLKIGDAGKVRIELDGTDLGYLGEEQQVKRITLPEPAE